MCGTRSRGPSRRRAASDVANAVSLLARHSVLGVDDHRAAIVHAEHAVGLHRALGHLSSQAKVIDTAGLAHVEMGHYAEAWLLPALF
jgi:hypothetical protein